MSNLSNAVAVLLITAMLFLTIGTSLVLAASDKYMANFGTLSLIIASLLTITAIFITPKK